jgi:hypothetical protein
VPAPFPSSEVTDDFNRANGALGGLWLNDPPGSDQPDFAIVSNQMVGAANAWAYYDLALGAVCEVRVTLAAYSAGFAELELLLGPGTAGWRGYTCGTGNGNSYITRYNADPTADEELSSFVGTFTDGDEMGMRVLAGGVIEFYGKPAAGSWSLLETVTDPDPLTGDFKAGIFASHASTVFDDFAVANVADSASSMFNLFRRRRKE